VFRPEFQGKGDKPKKKCLMLGPQPFFSGLLLFGLFSDLRDVLTAPGGVPTERAKKLSLGAHSKNEKNGVIAPWGEILSMRPNNARDRITMNIRNGKLPRGPQVSDQPITASGR